MSLRVERIDDNLVIHLNDKFDFSSAEDFKSAYAKETSNEFTVDFRETDYMDSSGLGMLLNMKRSIGGRSISLINCKAQIKKILIISKFDDQFTIN